jgi:chromosome partitioning protein
LTLPYKTRSLTPGEQEASVRTLAILSQKGGTGKTTVGVHLATAASARGKHVLIADLDPQRSAADWRRMRAAPAPALIEAKAGALFVASHTAERTGVDLMVLDTRPAQDSDIAEAVRLADLCLLVLRPSFFDIKAISRTLDMTRAMGKPALFVINQAPPQREHREPPAVLEAVAALRELGAPLAPVGLRSRNIYQSAVSRGLTAQETVPGGAAAQEINMLWTHVEQMLWPAVVPHAPAARPDPAPPIWRRDLDIVAAQ